MKQLLEEWSGKFEVNGEIDVSLNNLNVKEGDYFHVKLISKRREIDDDLLPAY